MSGDANRRHILVSDMGANAPRVTRYQIGDEVCESQFSALALSKLLPDGQRPDRVYFLLTPEAKAVAINHIEAEANEAGVPVEFITLPGNELPDDSRVLLERVADRIPQGCRLTLDVTQGLRHHAFLFYALALYLSEFRDVDISGAWYCRWEISRDGHVPRPFINLKPALDLAHWFHALAVFRDQGLTSPMAQRIQPTVDQLRQEARAQDNALDLHRRATALGKIVGTLEKHSFAYSAALPLELGKASRQLADRIPNLAESVVGESLPLAEALCEIIAEAAKPVAFDQAPPAGGDWKGNVQLSERELERQARLIDTYIERGQVSLAVGLMREWVISWVMLKQGITQDWLGYGARKPAEQRLGGLGALLKGNAAGIEINTAQKEFAEFWNKLSDELRNALLHHAMREQAIEEPPRSLHAVKAFWDRLKRGEVVLPEFGGGRGKLLICPIGLTPGVLYSALTMVRPNRVIVVCSQQSESAIPEAMEHAASSAEILTLKMNDIHRGVPEFAGLMDDASRWLFDADEIFACLTGGTTLMGVLVTRLVARAVREYQRPVRQFVLIDRRTPEEQRADPWQQGDIHYLD